MSRYCFTFGQDHVHRAEGVTLDCDSVVEIMAPDSESARAKMFELFGRKWSMQYDHDSINLSYFPRGIVLRLDVPAVPRETGRQEP